MELTINGRKRQVDVSPDKEIAMSTNSTRTMLARAMLAVTVGVTSFAASLWGQSPTASQTAAPEATHSNDIRLPYRLQLVGRDSAGGYVTSGVVQGETAGRAAVRLWFENGPSGQPGTARVHTHWAVRADPGSDSFEADLRGTLEPVSGQTRLAGTITSGPWRGQSVETESRILDFGPNGVASDVAGVMTIARPASAPR